MLVNLDCDNIMTPDYIRGVASNWRQKKGQAGWCAVASDCEGALTGRLAYRAQDFEHLRGYDAEGTPPAAGEDTDLRERLLAYAAMKDGHKDRSVQRTVLKGPAFCGSALPNDLSEGGLKHDRNIAKLSNVDPTILKQNGWTGRGGFSKMCASIQTQLYERRLKAGKVIRNNTVGYACTDMPWFGAWWVCISHTASEAAALANAGSDIKMTDVAEPQVPVSSPAQASSVAQQQPPPPPPAPRLVVSVRLMYGTMRFLYKRHRTRETFPYSSCIAHVCSRPCIIGASHSMLNGPH